MLLPSPHRSIGMHTTLEQYIILKAAIEENESVQTLLDLQSFTGNEYRLSDGHTLHGCDMDPSAENSCQHVGELVYRR